MKLRAGLVSFLKLARITIIVLCVDMPLALIEAARRLANRSRRAIK